MRGGKGVLWSNKLGKSSVLKRALGDFPGGPVVRTLPSNIRSCGFDPWLGSEDPTCLVAKKSKHETETAL